MWPETDYGRGKLGAHMTMCLVEIIARPEEFTKTSPYLVVPQEEFVQERYVPCPGTSFLFSNSNTFMKYFKFHLPFFHFVASFLCDELVLSHVCC